MGDRELNSEFPPSFPSKQEIGNSWLLFHKKIAKTLADSEKNTCIRRKISESASSALCLILTTDYNAGTITLRGGISIDSPKGCKTNATIIDESIVAQTINSLHEDVRKILAAHFIWLQIDAQYLEDRGERDSEKTHVHRIYKVEITPDKKPDNEEGELDERSPYEKEEDERARQDPFMEQFDPVFLHPLIESLPSLRAHHRAMVEGRVKPRQFRHPLEK